MIRSSTAAAALCLGLAVSGCDAGTGAGVLAVADEHELSIDQAVELLSSQNELPNRAEVVEAVADLWIDYTLLAQVALEDSLLESIDLTPLVRRQMEQEMVYRLRDAEVQIDTVVSEEELERLWIESGPEGRVSARHILLAVPDGATEAQRDSVRELAGDLKARLESGEDFGALARRYSADRGSAQGGGDLGTFGRGDMVAPFEAAAFALRPGEVSDPVETIYGLHVIRVDSMELETLDDEDTRTEFLAQIRAARVAAAESVYVASIEEPADVTVRPEAFDVMREIARRPGQRLSRRAAARPVASYTNGAVTVGEFQEFVQGQAPGFRSQVVEADSAALDGLIRGLARGELLVGAAEAGGYVLEEAKMDSLRESARNQMRVAAAQLGLVGVVPGEGQSASEAVAQRVLATLTEILQGRRDVIPLGVISYTLRQRYRAEVFPAAVDETVARIRQTGQRPASPAPTRAPNAPPPIRPDSGGSGG